MEDTPPLKRGRETRASTAARKRRNDMRVAADASEAPLSAKKAAGSSNKKSKSRSALAASKTSASTQRDRRERIRRAVQALGNLGEPSSAIDEEDDDEDVDERFVLLQESDRDAEAAAEAETAAYADGNDGEPSDNDSADEGEDDDDNEGEDEGEDEEDDASTADAIVNADADAQAAAKRPAKSARAAGLTSKDGVLYLGHIPHGFFEEQMRGFFSQFGKVRQLRLSRSKRTGRSRGYAFIQFESAEVARIVQRAMNQYILCDKLLVCEHVTPDKVHERMFAGANRPFRRVNWRKVAARAQNRERSEEEQARREQGLQKRHAKQAARLRAKGIDYELPGYVATAAASK